jgi:hypothetical protein
MRVVPPEAQLLVQLLVQLLAIVLVKSLVLGLVLELARSQALVTTQPIFAVAASRRPIAVLWLPSPRALN